MGLIATHERYNQNNQKGTQTMSILETIKENLRLLYETNPDIHVNVVVKSPKKENLYNVPVLLKGVYPHMFQIEANNGKAPKLYTHLYTDLITKDIEILELTCSVDQEIEGKRQKGRR